MNPPNSIRFLRSQIVDAASPHMSKNSPNIAQWRSYYHYLLYKVIDTPNEYTQVWRIRSRDVSIRPMSHIAQYAEIRVRRKDAKVAPPPGPIFARRR